MINVLNIRNLKKYNDFRCNVFVDRRNKILGNPFYMKHESQRQYVIEKYRQWFYTRINSGDKQLLNELNKLNNIHKLHGKLNLLCWCAPNECHADIIKEYLEKL